MKSGLTLYEEAFCQLVAVGKAATEAYSEAFGRAPKNRKQLENKAGYLSRRVDVVARIDEIRLEARRLNRAKWERRGEEIAEAIFTAISDATKAGSMAVLDKGVLHGVEVLAKLKGLNEPDTTVVKNGGVSDDFTPRGIENVSDEELLSVIRRDGAVDVESAVVGTGGEA